MYIEGYLLCPWTLMFGFAYNKLEDEIRVDIFLGLFAFAVIKPMEGDNEK